MHPSISTENRLVTLPAVKQWGDHLQFASEKLQKDKEVVLAAVKNSLEGIINRPS